MRCACSRKRRERRSVRSDPRAGRVINRHARVARVPGNTRCRNHFHEARTTLPPPDGHSGPYFTPHMDDQLLPAVRMTTRRNTSVHSKSVRHRRFLTGRRARWHISSYAGTLASLDGGCVHVRGMLGNQHPPSASPPQQSARGGRACRSEECPDRQEHMGSGGEEAEQLIFRPESLQ